MELARTSVSCFSFSAFSSSVMPLILPRRVVVELFGLYSANGTKNKIKHKRAGGRKKSR